MAWWRGDPMVVNWAEWVLTMCAILSLLGTILGVLLRSNGKLARIDQAINGKGGLVDRVNRIEDYIWKGRGVHHDNESRR